MTDTRTHSHTRIQTYICIYTYIYTYIYFFLHTYVNICRDTRTRADIQIGLAHQLDEVGVLSDGDGIAVVVATTESQNAVSTPGAHHGVVREDSDVHRRADSGPNLHAWTSRGNMCFAWTCHICSTSTPSEYWHCSRVLVRDSGEGFTLACSVLAEHWPACPWAGPRGCARPTPRPWWSGPCGQWCTPRSSQGKSRLWRETMPQYMSTRVGAGIPGGTWRISLNHTTACETSPNMLMWRLMMSWTTLPVYRVMNRPMNMCAKESVHDAMLRPCRPDNPMDQTLQCWWCRSQRECLTRCILQMCGS